MHTLQVVINSPLSAERVLEAAHDFSGRRPDIWPNVAREYFEVHDLRDTTADVTEGTKSGPIFGWERCDYDWSQPGVVTATVTDSNVYRPGSSWEVRATPNGDGSRVEMTWLREFTDRPMARFLSVVYRTLGPRLFAHDMRRMLANLASSSVQR
jgi:polyketide cyclase/dehydrase/lipid transport protein